MEYFGTYKCGDGKRRGREHVGLDTGGPFMLGQGAWTLAYSTEKF